MEFQNCSTIPQLPCYSPSPPSPSYSCELAFGERRLEHTPRSRVASRTNTSLFIKKAGRTTIVLNNQEDGVTAPSYGRQGTISGNIFLEQSESVLDVVVKVKGDFDVLISEAGGRCYKLIDLHLPLWSQPSGSQKLTCPDQIPFSFVLPQNFKFDETMQVLPPSFETQRYDTASLIVRSSYTMEFIITRIRHKKLAIWPKTKCIKIPFIYAPRTRAHRPIPHSPCFFSSVKTSPEEWHQSVTYLKTRSNVQIEPINFHFFVPGGRIYGVRDVIPFHVQLSGPTCSLQELFSDSLSLLNRVMTLDSLSTKASGFKKSPNAQPLLRVRLLRQISVSLKGEHSWRNTYIGEGTIWPIPPDLSSCCSTTAECKNGHLDWEGELRCNSDVVVGGFDAANVVLKDFITLTLSPRNPFTSPLLELQVTVPIRLVTDSWIEFDV